MNKAILIMILLISLIFLSGCVKEVVLADEKCRDLMGSMVGEAAGKVTDGLCENKCRAEDMGYVKWKCNKEDALVCLCQ